MKRLVIFLITMLFLSVPGLIHAQGFSVKAGANLSTWAGDDVESSNMRMGYQVGVQYRIEASEVLNVVPGIQLTQRGTQDQEKETFEWYQSTEISYEYQMKARLNYLDIPITLEYKIDPSLYLMARPTISFLLNSNYSMIERQCLGPDCTGYKDEDEIESMRDADFGLGLGIGYLFTDHIAISAGYQWGLFSLDDDGEYESFNRTLDLSIEYRF